MFLKNSFLFFLISTHCTYLPFTIPKKFNFKAHSKNLYQKSYNRFCIYTKAALDIGSGSTKLKVAKVDQCRSKILKIFLDKQVAVKYKKYLIKTKQGFKFNKAVQKQGLMVLTQLVKQAKRFKPKKFTAVATSAFRHASNAKSFVKKIKKKLNITVKIITQKQEAKLGFVAAQVLLKKIKKSKLKNKKIIVWDIGAGSMQIVYKTKNILFGRYLIYQGQLASRNFKNYIIKKIQKKTKHTTPNPLTKADLKNAKQYAVNYARKNLPNDIKKLFKKDVIVLGIGGVHYYSVFKQIKKLFNIKNKKINYYSLHQLQKTLKQTRHYSDKQIGGSHTSSSLSNLVLVFAFAKYLNINKIYVSPVNLSDGLLLN